MEFDGLKRSSGNFRKKQFHSAKQIIARPCTTMAASVSSRGTDFRATRFISDVLHFYVF
jgi:hypothetical protein